MSTLLHLSRVCLRCALINADKTDSLEIHVTTAVCPPTFNENMPMNVAWVWTSFCGQDKPDRTEPTHFHKTMMCYVAELIPGYNEEEDLYRHLLHRYSKEIRPVKSAADQVYVNLTFSLKQIHTLVSREIDSQNTGHDSLQSTLHYLGKQMHFTCSAAMPLPNTVA